MKKSIKYLNGVGGTISIWEESITGRSIRENGIITNIVLGTLEVKLILPREIYSILTKKVTGASKNSEKKRELMYNKVILLLDFRELASNWEIGNVKIQMIDYLMKANAETFYNWVYSDRFNNLMKQNEK